MGVEIDVIHPDQGKGAKLGFMLKKMNFPLLEGISRKGNVQRLKARLGFYGIKCQSVVPGSSGGSSAALDKLSVLSLVSSFIRSVISSATSWPH